MILSISETAIQHHATDQSYSRGEDYYERGAVTDLVQRGNTIAADVEGSEVTPYRVSLQFDAGGIMSARCTCPYDYDGWCKHIVAAMLACVRQPERIEVRPPLTQLLEQLDLAQTKQLIQTLVTEQPELIDAVDRQVMLLAHPMPPRQSAKSPRRSPIDVAPFKRQVKYILREGLRSLEDGYEDDPFTESLQEVIDKAVDFAQNGDGASAIAILTAITQTCVDEWDDLCDYGGDSFDITLALNEAWAAAILWADLDDPERVDLEVMLTEWQEALHTDFSMSLAALQQGWDDPQLQRALQGRGYSDPERLEDPLGQSLAMIRLQILDQQGRSQEYLHLARVEGLITQYLTRLAELGEVETVMTAAQERMTTADEAFALAKTLRASDYLAEALAIAQAGLLLPGRCGYELASWTSELAEGLSDIATAQHASTIAFKLEPNFTDYQRLEHLAGDQWPTLKPELLTSLRQAQTWQANEAKVDIFLHEELIEDAIASVRSDSYYRSELVLRVMQAAVSTHPDWVIETARKQAESIMDQGKADRYAAAVNWLKQAKAAYIQSGRRADWQTYFSRLQSVHSRKRKLMDLFNQLR
ncbi:MAG: SWIM zinc finger family protein [Leptolyngbyaceae cyanobacterium bins.349]|nr:SWIM zinc finger family protein [Leptolyngbyaceae cyanobacterium bins.349]